MRKFFKALTLLGFVCAAVIFGMLGFAERTVPDELYVAQDRSPWGWGIMRCQSGG